MNVTDIELIDDLDITTFEEVEEKEVSIYRPDEEIEVKMFLSRFFKDKQLFDGSSIPDEMLYDKENLDILIDIEFTDQMDMIYREMGTSQCGDRDQGGNISWDVRFVLNHLKECSGLKIPRKYAAGIILIFVKLCRTYNIFCLVH